MLEYIVGKTQWTEQWTSIRCQNAKLYESLTDCTTIFGSLLGCRGLLFGVAWTLLLSLATSSIRRKMPPVAARRTGTVPQRLRIHDLASADPADAQVT